MDKQDYRTKLDEAKKRIEEGDKEEAFYILDGMNWRRVHNVNALLSAADIYEKEGRYERAKELLELAHERSPIGRIIIYRLALLSIRLEEYAEAKEYYEEFIEIAPHDSLQYIIQFKLAKAQGVEDITLISILEELKEHDFLEEWAYELALLYHKTGQINKCISTCDEIILWYGDGPYVESALELKLLYQPLDEGQKDKYKDFLKRRDGIIEVKPGEEFGGNGEILTAPIEIPEVALSNDRFNTQNLQAEIKRNIEEIMQATKTGDISRNLRNIEGLVEDIPFAKVPRDDTGPMEEASIKKEEGRKIDDTLRNHFREYLEEERDGQMSLSLPDTREAEPQVAGQMTIDQIIEDWQKTARAAEAALSEADEQRLENAKARALDEANHIYERLEQAGRKMEAGVAPKDLLRSEYMSDLPTHRQELGNRFSTVKKQLGAAGGEEAEAQKKAAIRSQDTTFLPTGSRARQRRGGQKPREDAYLPAGAKATADTIRVLEEEGPQETLRRFATKRIDKPEKSEREKEREALKNQSTFKIRKVDAQTGEGNGVGFEVPIMESEDLPKKSEDSAARAEQLSRDAVRIVSDVNEMLQKEIDRATGRMPRRAEIEAEMNRREGSESASEATVADVLNILEKAVDGNTGRIDLARIPKEQTQAFAEAVVRILNERAREDEAARPKVGFDTMARTMLTEVETGVQKDSVSEPKQPDGKRSVGFDTMSRTMLTEIETGGEEPAAESVPASAEVPLVEVETGSNGKEEAGKEAVVSAAALEELKTGEAAGEDEKVDEKLVKVALNEVETGSEVAAEPEEKDISQEELDEVETGIEAFLESVQDSRLAKVPLDEVETGAEARREVRENAGGRRAELEEIETGGEQPPQEDARLAKLPLKEVETGIEDRREVGRRENMAQALQLVETGEKVPADSQEAHEEDVYPEEEGASYEEDVLAISDEQFVNAIYDEAPQTELTDEEREMFTYFTPISGMEATLCEVLSSTRAKLLSERVTPTGHILIQGGEGSGKTTLATTLLSVLKTETGKPDGRVGRLDGVRLNTKDLSKLFDKIRGGCLIIERVGEITRNTALELSAQMEQDRSGILVILEDARIGIERAMALNPMFSRRFTEKIVIPVLSIDELANFAQAYAVEQGYSIDEMGVLALYDRINLIQRTDHPTNLTEVKEIVDEAIDIAEGTGFRGLFGRFAGRHYDADGNLILQEKDFHGR